MNLFDKFVDKFSSSNLKRRVWGIIILGLVLCVITIACGVYFLNSVHTYYIEGIGEWDTQNPGMITVKFSKGLNEQLQAKSPYYIIIETPAKKEARMPANIASIEPANSTLTLFIPDVDESDIKEGPFNLRLIVLEEPYWKLLLGGKT